MILEIRLEKSHVKITLMKDGVVIAEKSWEGDLSLSERLLVEIDGLFEKNNIAKDDIQKAVAIYDERSSVTSARIVQTVADAWNLSK